MGFARGIERRLRRLVDGLATCGSSAGEFILSNSARCWFRTDLGIDETPGGWGVPNRFVVTMGGEPVDGECSTPSSAGNAAFVETPALERGWRLEGPARIAVAVDSARRPAEVEIDAAIRPRTRPVWKRLKPVDGTNGPLDVAINRAVVGRSATSDVRAADRRRVPHAVIWQEAGSAWVGDLRVANGTYVNGGA